MLSVALKLTMTCGRWIEAGRWEQRQEKHMLQQVTGCSAAAGGQLALLSTSVETSSKCLPKRTSNRPRVNVLTVVKADGNMPQAGATTWLGALQTDLT